MHPYNAYLRIYMYAREILVAAVWIGGSMKESEIEKILVDGVRKLGGRAYKFVSPGNVGVPDRIIVLDGLQVIFVEMKTETGRLTELQKRQIEFLSKQGKLTRVLYGEEDTRAFLEELKEALHEF